MLRTSSTTLLVSLLAAGCGDAHREPRPASEGLCSDPLAAVTTAPEDRVRPAYAENFDVHYGDGFKRVEIRAPWGGSDRSWTYYLVPCDRPAPDLPPEATVIRIPPRRVATTSTTQLPHFVALDLLDRLAGHNRLGFIYDPDLRARATAGKMREIGDGVRLNPESLIELAPDLVLATSIGSPELDVLGVLERTGAPATIDAAFMEATPLGRAEWIKLTATFFNREAEANAIFTGIAERYEALRAKADSAGSRPTVLVGTPFQGTWHVSGGDGYQARLIADAGADYLWSEDRTRGALSLDFETVYARGLEADVWLHAYGWQNLELALRNDPRMGAFAAFRAARVYNNDLRVSDGGGNDYWESGSLRPDRILADLVSILHPALLPDHELVFHRRLAP